MNQAASSICCTEQYLKKIMKKTESRYPLLNIQHTPDNQDNAKALAKMTKFKRKRLSVLHFVSDFHLHLLFGSSIAMAYYSNDAA